MPVRKVCGTRYRPSAHFAPPSTAAHETAIAIATGKCAAINGAGRRIRTAQAENAQTGGVNTAQHHQPVSCQARIQLQPPATVLLVVWQCTWIENSSATA